VTTIDSNSAGNADRFRSLADLEEMLEALPRGNEDRGRVALLMRRCEGGRRETLHKVVLAPDLGVPGDAWCRAAQRNEDMQIAVMEKDVAELIANGQSLTLFGNGLILDLDLSSSNLPPGSCVRVGGAILEVTPMPHNGCRKFHARFGNDALRFVSMRELRSRNLRGIYMRVVKGGEVAAGDSVDVISRASLPDAALRRLSRFALRAFRWGRASLQRKRRLLQTTTRAELSVREPKTRSTQNLFDGGFPPYAPHRALRNRL
jgi:MOSC domain-containing protein YiiM